MRTLIVGCGYVGVAAGRLLAAAGHEVLGLRRTGGGTAEMQSAGIRPVQGDVTSIDDLARLPGNFDWVVHTVSSSRGGAAEYRSVYLDGTRNLLQWASTQPIRKIVYTSSTSVYSQADGSEVTETAPAEPTGDTGRLLRETEELLLAVASHGAQSIPSVVLRVAGIYGPGRGHLFQQFLRGEARLTGDGRRFLNMVHRDDVASAIVACLQSDQSAGIYNVVDDESVTQRDFLQWAGVQLGLPLPPSVDPAELVGRKRGLTHKRVSNRRIRSELGWSPAYPTFREGYAAAVVEALKLP